jgi:hypothetical protein
MVRGAKKRTSSPSAVPKLSMMNFIFMCEMSPSLLTCDHAPSRKYNIIAYHKAKCNLTLPVSKSPQTAKSKRKHVSSRLHVFQLKLLLKHLNGRLLMSQD